MERQALLFSHIVYPPGTSLVQGSEGWVTISFIFGSGSEPNPKGLLSLKCYSLPVVMHVLKDQPSLPPLRGQG
jgi:hypothetical protein